jgi:PEP-CTERM motif
MRRSSYGILFISALIVLPAQAGTFSLTLSNSTLSTTPGDPVTFSATLLNNTGVTENLNGDSFDAPSPLTLDDSPFLNNWPLSVANGGTFGPTAIFTIDVPIGTPTGLYTGGFFEILGGPGVSDADVLATVDYTVNVTSSVSTPEPSSVILIGGGIGVLFLAIRRRTRLT